MYRAEKASLKEDVGIIGPEMRLLKQKAVAKGEEKGREFLHHQPSSWSVGSGSDLGRWGPRPAGTRPCPGPVGGRRGRGEEVQVRNSC